MRVILTRPKYDSHLITPPLGMAYISSYLKKYGHDVRIIDGLNLDLSNNQIVEKCRGADIVGIFLMSAYFLDGINLSRKLKNAGLKVVIGGPHASILHKLTLKETNADYVIMGEGEKTFIELLNALENNRSTEDIAGVVTKKTKKIIKREFIQNLDELPFPDWEQMDPRKYKKAPHGALIKNFPVAPITSTRGCPYECTFCASPKLWGRTIRYRSPKNVVDEIEMLVTKFGVKEIHFEDDNLTLKREHIKKICKLILERGLRISWACPNGVRADKLDADLLKLMKKSGCYYLAFGIESGNQYILNNIKKHITLEKIREAVKMAEAEGIMTQGFFIFGLPGETRESVRNTIRFAKSLPLSRAQFLLLDVLPGSEIWDDLKFDQKVDWTKHSYQEVTWVPPTIDKNYLNNAFSMAFKEFFFRPKQMFSLIRYFKLSQIPFVLKRVTDFRILKKANNQLK